MNEYKPSLVIVSSSNTKPKSLVKLLTKHTTLTEDENEPHKISHPWQIDTKYYTADIIIHGLTEQYERTKEFNEKVEAMILHMDSNKESGLDDLEKWKHLEADCEPDIKILLSNYCTTETKVTKMRATEWCVKRGFELIELYPQHLPTKQDDDEIMEEKVGVERIVEVLQTHVWSNLVMKDKRMDGKNLGTEGLSDASDDFTDLFAQLHMMKESIQSMPVLERKQCAEQMVTAFWKAIGGDEEEISDI